MENLFEITLVIENNTQRNYIESILFKKFINIAKFSDAEDALDFLRNNDNPLKIVIVGDDLTTMPAIELISSINDFGKNYATIFLTSDKSTDNAFEAIKAGAFCFVPISKNLEHEIFEIIERVYLLQENNVENKKLKNDLHASKLLLDEVLKQKEHTTSSIYYSERIQKALLPPEDYIKDLFNSFFVMYNPRDIISGDFYWFNKINDQVIFAAADCTGHGVPGALMSMLGMSGLSQITQTEFLNYKTVRASEILNKLRVYIINSLRQTGRPGETTDGMDIALCILDNEKRLLQYSGANNPLLLVRNNELTIYDGDKMPIGIHRKASQPFTNHEIQLENNDLIYIFSDGYADQFGTSNNTKFLSKNFKQSLLEISDMPLPSQKKILEKIIEKWKGQNNQTDDILIIGIKIKLKEEEENFSNINWKGKKILIVEDDPGSSLFLGEILEETGASLLFAFNGQKAIDYCKEVDDIDVVIMDIHMPIMDGNEATQRIKQFKKNLPVIIQSAYNIDGEKDISFSSGCDDYISKPVDKKILIEKISKYINVRKATS